MYHRKKFGKILGKLWLGTKELVWLRESIDKAILANTSREFFEHRRDGYKALHVIRRFNPHDNFLEVSDSHSFSHQGVIRIPEGEKRKGWTDFSLLCKRNWDTNLYAKGTQVNYGGDW